MEEGAGNCEREVVGRLDCHCKCFKRKKLLFV